MTDATFTVELTATDVLTIVNALKTERIKANRHVNRATDNGTRALRSLDVARIDHVNETLADAHKRALDSIIGGTS